MYNREYWANVAGQLKEISAKKDCPGFGVVKIKNKKTLTQILYYGKWVENSLNILITRFCQTFSVLGLIKTYKIYLISNTLTTTQVLSKIINSFADLQITPLIAFILIHKGIHAYIILYLSNIFVCVCVDVSIVGEGFERIMIMLWKNVTGFLNNHSHTPFIFHSFSLAWSQL